jgi:hypothetical protein
MFQLDLRVSHMYKRGRYIRNIKAQFSAALNMTWLHVASTVTALLLLCGTFHYVSNDPQDAHIPASFEKALRLSRVLLPHILNDMKQTT